MMRSHKYTDRDVREQPTLLGIAANYALHYEGEFQFMLDAQTMMRERGTLPVQVARGVLNCMLADPRVFDMPATKKREAPTPPQGSANVIDISTKQPAEKKEPLAHRVMTTPKIKAKFFTARNAEVVHRLRSAQVEWRLPYGHDRYADRAPRTPVLRLNPLCKREGYSGWYEKADLQYKVSTGDRLCRTGCWSVYCEACDKLTKPEDILEVTLDGKVRLAT